MYASEAEAACHVLLSSEVIDRIAIGMRDEKSREPVVADITVFIKQGCVIDFDDVLSLAIRFGTRQVSFGTFSPSERLEPVRPWIRVTL